MPDLTPIIDAVHLKNWYALAGLLLTLLVQLIRKQPKLAAWFWNWWPDGYRWVPVAITGAVVAFSVSFQGGASFVAALQAAIGGALGIGGSAMGFAAWLKESPVRWDGGAGGVTPAPKTPRTGAGAAPITMIALFLGALALSPSFVACSPSSVAKDPAAAGAKARETARVVYLAGSQAVWLLEEARIVWMKSKVSPTASEVEIAEKVGAALHAAKDALDKAKPWLETGAGEAEGKRAIREGIDQAEAVAGLLMGAGAKVPKPVTDGLAAARAALGGDS